jgi:hypothetical protein
MLIEVCKTPYKYVGLSALGWGCARLLSSTAHTAKQNPRAGWLRGLSSNFRATKKKINPTKP